MNETTSTARPGLLFKLPFSIETVSWDCFCQTLIGFEILPVMSWWFGDNRLEWILVPFFLGMLVLLRVSAAFIRRLLPFPDAVQRVWAERRRLAKLYDSYQWRKLFWSGAGLALGTVVSGRFTTPRIVVFSVCLLAGTVGLVRWWSIRSKAHPGPLL